MEESAKQQSSRMDLTQGNVAKGLLTFMLPIIIGNLFTQLYNMVDSIIVGQFLGGTALAAVGACFTLNMMVNAFLVAVGSGATVVVSQYLGARNRSMVNKAVNTALVLALIVGILVTILWMVIAGPLLTLMDTPENIYDDGLAYFQIIILGTTGHLYYQMGSAILRGMGDSVWPLGLLIFCSILNIILDILFVPVIGMGVTGAAWATILAQLVSAVAVVVRICGKKYNLTVRPSTLRLNGMLAKSVLLIGIPAGLQQLVTSGGSTVVQVFTNNFGSDVVAANSAIIKVDGFIVLPLMAISQAMQTYVGQNVGAGKLDRLKEGTRLSLWLGVIISVVLGIVLMIIAPWAIRLFTTEEAIVTYGAQGLRILALFYIFMAIAQILTGVMRGAGASTLPMIASFVMIVVRIIGSYLLAYRTGDFRGLYYSMILGNASMMIVLIIYYRMGNWKNASLMNRGKGSAKTAALKADD